MAKIDLTKQSKVLYAAAREPELVDVPGFTFPIIDGHGDPDHADACRQLHGPCPVRDPARITEG
ncbi:hypothetical protein IWX63_002837 [Arthrobacter sp. CAN_A2]|uniref:hypothetical protein n=1 Tax=Arthrobacter sp. CAN_A2 TaxID=2787718 RepID=UPI0018F03B63